ncbi:short chain dehydrogenase reductase [Westerdykella ornata]|uniref:Short chain dehydrogenase reductase n=1 Tax=Westerdykella ornata TaxID=318751 RepID=A0A6A6JYI0_WESOR|nr:short chain dehydrogenase reductase [Westerdykella ornata]KAF2281457.1 short chain dehydrogenase reductase [Westerdykella ornata]
MASLFITGASRGLGLALVRELASLPSSKVRKVIAGARGDASALKDIAEKSDGRVSVVQLDVTNPPIIQQAAAETERLLEGKGLDVLVNNAGICQYAFGGVATMDNLEESFTVNVMGVHWVTQAFLPLLRKGNLKKVINIRRLFPCAGIQNLESSPDALTVQYALDYEKERFTFIALCPGWLKTDLGGGDIADLTPEEGAKASLDIIFQQGTGGQRDHAQGPNVYDGTNVPW